MRLLPTPSSLYQRPEVDRMVAAWARLIDHVLGDRFGSSKWDKVLLSGIGFRKFTLKAWPTTVIILPLAELGPQGRLTLSWRTGV